MWYQILLIRTVSPLDNKWHMLPKAGSQTDFTTWRFIVLNALPWIHTPMK